MRSGPRSTRNQPELADPVDPVDIDDGDGSDEAHVSGGDEPAEPDVHDEVPARLEVPLEVPDADALDQAREVAVTEEY